MVGLDELYGTVYQDEPTYKVDVKGEDADMIEIEARLKELDAEIESYREAILEAEAALDSAEKELSDVLQGIPD